MDRPQRVLVILLRYIGDVLLASPILGALRRAFPEARLSMLVNPGTEEVLTGNPDLDEVLILDRTPSTTRQLRFIGQLRRRRFDHVIDLTDGDRAAVLSWLTGAAVRIGYNDERLWRGRLYNRVIPPSAVLLHRTARNARALEALGVHADALRPRIWTSRGDEAAAAGVLEAFQIASDEPFVAIHPGARTWLKRWPADRFAAVADHIQEAVGFKVLVLGGEGDRGVLRKIAEAMRSPARSVAGGLRLLELAVLLSRARLLVSNDSGPMHIAAGMGTRVVALFGPTNPREWGPIGSGHRVLYPGLDCRACGERGCKLGDGSCMRLISLDEVIMAVEECLSRSWQRASPSDEDRVRP